MHNLSRVEFIKALSVWGDIHSYFDIRDGTAFGAGPSVKIVFDGQMFVHISNDKKPGPPILVPLYNVAFMLPVSTAPAPSKK